MNRICLPAVLLATFVVATSSIGCADSGADSTSTASPVKNGAAQTTIDLKTFRKSAIDKLRPILGKDVDVESGQIVFRDGASSIGFPPAFDQATLFYVVDLPPTLEPVANTDYAFAIGLNGSTTTTFVNRSALDVIVFGEAVLATLSDDALAKPQGERKKLTDKLIADIKTASPTAEVELFELSGVLAVSAPSASELVAACKVLKASGSVNPQLEMEPTMYPAPYEFATPIELGTGAASKQVDLVSLTTLTKELRSNGHPFATLPSLPAPFGPGEKRVP